MKKIVRILSFLVVALCPLIWCCSDDGSHNPSNPLYDLRPLTRVFESFDSTTEDLGSPVSRKTRARHASIPMGKRIAPGLSIDSALESDSVQEILTFTYGSNAHLFWTEAIGKDAQGELVTTALQALDDAGFPTRSLWYDGEGIFKQSC